VSNPWEATELFQKMLAEYTENGYQQGVREERERIISNIYDRVSDLRSCTKQDNCIELGELIEEYIPEWTKENNK
jgi:alpha-L-fucosidase